MKYDFRDVWKKLLVEILNKWDGHNEVEAKENGKLFCLIAQGSSKVALKNDRTSQRGKPSKVTE